MFSGTKTSLVKHNWFHGKKKQKKKNKKHLNSDGTNFTNNEKTITISSYCCIQKYANNVVNVLFVQRA